MISTLRTIAMFVISDLQKTMQHKRHVDMYHQTKVHMPSSLFIAIRSEGKEHFRKAAMLVFHILEKEKKI
jgi:hypothetical protein